MIILMIVLGFVCSCLVWYVIVGQRKLVQRLQKVEGDNLKLKKDFKGICASAIGLGNRLTSFENQIEQLSWQRDKTELRQSSLSSYAHATKIVEMGGNIDDIVESCGLTRAEAELVTVLYHKNEIKTSTPQETDLISLQQSEKIIA